MNTIKTLKNHWAPLCKGDTDICISSPGSSETSRLPFDKGEGVEGEGLEDHQEKIPKRPKSSAECLKDWVQKQRFIPQDLSDDFFTLFLSSANYNVESAAEKLENYFYSRQEPSPLFRDRDPLGSDNVRILRKLYVLPMPDTTEDGRKIILTGLVKPSVTYSQMDHAKVLAMVFDLLIWEKDFGSGDFVIVLDGRGFECPQLLENKVRNRKSIKYLLQDTIPGTLRSFYFLCPPSHVTNVADTRNGLWVTVVKSIAEMVNYLPANVLPLEFGGDSGHLEDLLEQWHLHLVENRNFFIHFEKRMIHLYERKLCYEKEIKERGKNWVQQMKLEADEWEYKIQYYKRMSQMIPPKHPAFGSQRTFLKPKERVKKDPMTRCRRRAKEELEADKVFEPSPLYNGYAKEIQRAKLESERIYLKPVLELLFYCFKRDDVAEDKNCY